MRRLSEEEQYAKVHEGCTALAILYYRERKKPEEERDPFLVEGGQGFNALEHLRDLAYYLAENFGVSNLYCAECGELIEDGGEALEYEGFHAACGEASDAEEASEEAVEKNEGRA